jgi:hypothetical protein
MFRISSNNFYFEHTLRDLFTVSDANRTFKSYNLNSAKPSPHISWLRNAYGTKGTRCFSLLPHRRSWGSGRWMCTCTAKSRHNPRTIQSYIPNIVQRNDSSSSQDEVMDGSLDWFLLSVYSELLLDVGNEDGEQFVREDWSGWESALVANSQAS